MPSRILKYLGDHALATTALVVALLALGGSSYAAFTISGSQIRNHTIDPVKLNPRLIAGNVRAWARVAPSGRVIAGGGRPRVFVQAQAGAYEIRWGVKVGRRCATVATIDSGTSAATETVSGTQFAAGYANAESSGVHHSRSDVQSFNQNGQPTPLGFNVAVVC